MTFDQRFLAWFIRVLAEAIEAMDLTDGDEDVSAGTVVVPGVLGQVARDTRGGLIATPRESNLYARPRLPLTMGVVDGWQFAYGDNRRIHLALQADESALAISPPHLIVTFADILTPQSPAHFAAAFAFRTYPTSPHYVDTALLSLPGVAAYPLRTTPQGAWATPYPPPPTHYGELGYLPLMDDGNYDHTFHFFSSPTRDTDTWGLLPAVGNQHRPSAWFTPNDYLWEWARRLDPRHNTLLPFMAGVDSGGLYLRVPQAVASHRPNAFAFLHGFAEWTFPPLNTGTIGILYAATEWGQLTGHVAKEAGFPYLPEGATMPAKAIAVTAFESLFMAYPITSGWKWDADLVRYYLDDYQSVAAYPGDILAVGQHWDDVASVLFTAHSLAHENQVERYPGPVLDSVSALTRFTQTVGTQRVYEGGTVSAGEGALRIERFGFASLSGVDGYLYSTPERRVVDRLGIHWSVTPEQAAGPLPPPPGGESVNAPYYLNMWRAAGDVRLPGTTVATATYVDWGICNQDYRVIVSRESEDRGFGASEGQRSRRLYLNLQRKNNGGDFIAERGLTHWGRITTSVGFWFRTNRRWVLPDTVDGWWTNYSALDVRPGGRSDEYFAWRHAWQPAAAEGNLTHGSVNMPRSAAGFEQQRGDLFVSNPSGRMVDGLGVEGLSGRDLGLHHDYPNPPVTMFTTVGGNPQPSANVAQPSERAGIWYSLAMIEIGARTAFTPAPYPTLFDFEEDSAGGEVQAIIDDAGVPYWNPENGTFDKHSALGYPNLADILARYVNGANLYEGPLGTLPVPLAGVSRIETFCGLDFDAGGFHALDVALAPDGDLICVAVDIAWSYRISRGSPAGGWSLVAAGASITELLLGNDATDFDTSDMPIQEYRFILPDWPSPIGTLRSTRTSIAFRAREPHAASGDTRPVIARIAGWLT
ncbi:MAG: hypothetical protein H0U69_03380 [Trueperaceae bacterium]|nr:hypothetical protein [Trueperaceae bacterium]